MAVFAHKEIAISKYRLVITSINVGLVTMSVLAVIALIVLIIVGIIVYNNSIISFKGTIEVKTCVNDVEKSDRREGRRGNVKLSKFKVDDLGLRKNTRFQATGKDYIYFIIKPGLYMGNRKIKKVKINGDGSELRLYKKVSNGTSIASCTNGSKIWSINSGSIPTPLSSIVNSYTTRATFSIAMRALNFTMPS